MLKLTLPLCLLFLFHTGYPNTPINPKPVVERFKRKDVLNQEL
jgi:hypothetical protein